MERPHDILGRMAQRRHPLSEQQRAYQQERAPQDAQHQSSPLSQRRPSQDQSNRPGKQTYNQAPSSQHGANNHASSRVRNHYGQPSSDQRSTLSYNSTGSSNNTGHTYNEQPARHTPQNYQQQRPVVMDSMTAYQSRPLPHQDQQRISPLQAHPTSNYYPLHASDDYSSQLRSDAIEEWEDEGMGYGDWEDEDEEGYVEDGAPLVEEPVTYVPPPTPQPRHTMAETDPSARATRNLRDTQYVSPLAAARQRLHGSSNYQKVTQPLDSRTIQHTRRGQDMPQEYESSRMTDPRLLKSLRSRQARQEQRQRTAPTLPPPSNVPPSLKPAKPSCLRCHGAGFLRADVPFGHPNFGKPIACECKEVERKDKRRHQLRDMSNMDAFLNNTFDTFNPHIPGVREAFQNSLDFAENPHGWLLLIGPNGCGKTHLAASIANQVLEGGSVVLFEPVPDLLDHLRAAFAPTATEVYDQLFSKMREAELLVLDDLGAQQSSPWANEKLFQLLNYRYNIGMPTVITANPRGVQGIDERIRSRLGDTALVRQINMDRARDFRPTNPRK